MLETGEETALKKKLSACVAVFTLIILVLAGALAYAVTALRQKDKAAAVTRERLKESGELLSSAESSLSDYRAKAEEKDRLNSDLQDKLNKAEEENAELRKKLETLSAKKAEEQAGLIAASAEKPSGRHVCYLTFDDGPSDNTLEILEILRKYGIKATFFVINSEKLDYVKNIYEAGHTVGLHSATHNYGEIYKSTQAYLDDLKVISDRVESIIGIAPKVMRFPGGSSNSVSRKYCAGVMSSLTRAVEELGYSYYDWNVSSGDALSETPSFTYIRNNVLKSARDKNSACVLMHDSDTKTTTVKALPEIIEGLMKMGYSFEPITPEAYGYHHNTLN